MNKLLITFVAGLVLGGLLVVGINLSKQEKPLGGAGSTYTELLEFMGGFILRDTYSTTTPAAATLSAKETAGYSTVNFYPSVGAVTLTLPASSTLASIIPKAGDMKRVCYYNATTTAAINITLAAGTGIDVESASTTNQTAGSTNLVIGPDSTACIEYQKKGSSSSTAANRNDITARITRFIDGD